MDDLSTSLDSSKWQKQEVGNKTDYTEFHVMRQHQKVSPTAFSYLIQTDAEEDPKAVLIEGTLKDKDPLKDIHMAELKLNGDLDKVLGIDLDGDCMERK